MDHRSPAARTTPPTLKFTSRHAGERPRVVSILDDSNRTGKYSAADFLARAGIPTYINAKHAIAHSKIILIDDVRVITGSFNFTKAAEESNAENLLVLRSPELAARYLDNWNAHQPIPKFTSLVDERRRSKQNRTVI